MCVVSMNFLEQYPLLPVFQNRDYFGVMAAGLVVDACSSLVHNLVWKVGVQNPPVRVVPDRSLHTQRSRLGGSQKRENKMWFGQWVITLTNSFWVVISGACI